MQSDIGEQIVQLPDRVFGGSYEHGAGRRRILTIATMLLAIVIAGTATAAAI